MTRTEEEKERLRARGYCGNCARWNPAKGDLCALCREATSSEGLATLAQAADEERKRANGLRRHAVEVAKTDGSLPSRWIDASGRGIKWRELSDSHLANIVKLLVRKASAERIRVTASYLVGPQPQGDGAVDCFDRELYDVSEASWVDFTDVWYRAALKEVRRRNLTATRVEALAECGREQDKMNDLFLLRALAPRS